LPVKTKPDSVNTASKATGNTSNVEKMHPVYLSIRTYELSKLGL